MKMYYFLFLFILNQSIYAKEWKSLRVYHKSTNRQTLLSSDWLKSDRLKNTLVWQHANQYNLTHNLPEEYGEIKERKDFYKWLFNELNKKGHEVLWIKMAHYISTKLHKIESFPYSIFSSKKVLKYTKTGSKQVFNKAFVELKLIYKSHKIYKGNMAERWDKNILYKEQYLWIDGIYKTMDENSLKKLSRIAKGNFLYALVVPKSIRFKGNLANTEARYNYAFNTLRAYCKNRYDN